MQSEKNNQGKSWALRTFWFVNLAHFLHDGFTDMLYVFFPVWQTQWALSFAQVGLFKMLISGSTALFQIPSGLLAERAGRVRLLLAFWMDEPAMAIGAGSRSVWNRVQRTAPPVLFSYLGCLYRGQGAADGSERL